MENTQEPVKKAKKVYRSVRKFRTPEALQRYIEEQIYALDCKEPHLKPGQKGYVEGADTPNPAYLEGLSDKERMQLRMQCLGHLKSLLPIHEAEQRVGELEQKLMQLVALIEERAPYLLSGDPSGMH